MAFVLLIAGCVGTEEEAPVNLKKGDECFDKKEYEVAEYYYEKIPEESPLHEQASKRLDEIKEIKAKWADKTVSEADIAKIIVTDHSYGIDNVLHIPTHRLLLFNHNQRNIASLTVEFSYYRISGELIGQLTTDVKVVVKSKDQNECTGIQPGRVGEVFAKSSARIIGARYQ